MAAEPEHRPGAPGGSAAPVQRPPEADQVAEAWLVEAGQIELADSVDRMAGDIDLATAMALAGFTGPLWEHFANEVAKYGYAVIASWLGRGMIFERCRSKGFGALPSLGRVFTEDEIVELANETVAKALHHFRVDVLMKRRWDPTKGATLRTFFIGQCLIRFPNIYRRWHAGEMRNRMDLTEEFDVDEHFVEELGQPERRAVASVVASGAMATVKDPRVRKAMHMTADGWPQAEIARVLGVSVKSVERMLANERARLRKRGVG